jgi:hypothetical protein
MGSLFRGIATAAALLLTAAAPAGAAPAWSDPVPLSEPGVSGARVAMDARGNALVVWDHHYGDRTPTWSGNRIASSYRWYLPGRGWSPLRDLPRAAGFVADVKITPRGEVHALVVGTGAELVPVGIWTATPGEPLEKAAAVTDEAYAGVPPGLGLDDAGNAIVAWAPRQQQDQPVLVASRPAGGEFGPPQAVGRLPNGHPGVAMNPAGAAAVTWSDYVSRERVAYRPAGGQFGEVEDPDLDRHAVPRLGLDLDGRLVLAGRLNTGSPWMAGGPPPHAAVTARAPLGGWSQSQTVEEDAYVTSMVVGARGVATLVANRRSANDPETKSHIVTRHPDGRLEREEVSARTAGNPMLAIDHRGDVLVAWADGHGNPDRAVHVRERAAGAASFGPSTAVADAMADVAVPALNDLGQAVVVWRQLTWNGERYESGPITAVVRDDPALHDEPAPPDVTLYKDPLAALDEDGDLRAPVSCDRGCKVTSAGVVFPGGGQQALAGRGRSVRLKARRRTRVKLDFGADGARAVRDALAAGRRPWVSVTVSGRGRSPRPLVVSRRYKLRR